MNSVAQGKENVVGIDKYFKKEQKIYPDNVYRLRFITNHDEIHGQEQLKKGWGKHIKHLQYLCIPSRESLTV